MKGTSDDILKRRINTQKRCGNVPTPSLDITKTALEICPINTASERDRSELDRRHDHMKRIEQSGFIKALYKK